MRLGALAILLAQVIALAGPGGIVLCVHEDGTARYESVAALCCEGSQSGETSPPQAGSDGIAAAQDHCLDCPASLTAVPPASWELLAPIPGDPCSALPGELPRLWLSLPDSRPSCGGNASGPPLRGDRLAHLSTVVLQV